MITSHKHIRITDIDAAYQSNNCSKYMPPWNYILLVCATFIECSLPRKHTLVMNNVDTDIMSKQDTKVASVLCDRKRGYSSKTAEMIASI